MAQLSVGSLRAGCVPGARAAEWMLLPAAVQTRLVEVGWTASGLGTLGDLEQEELRDVLGQSLGCAAARVLGKDLEVFEALVEMAAAMAARRDAGLMRLSPGELALDVAIGRKRIKLRADAAAHVLELPACPPRGCRAQWPSRHLRKMSQAGAG
eukprot:4459734-Heterocapsa_arctica.AAC.1